MLCSVWLLDQDRVHMRAIAAPTLPESYIAALDGFVVGPQGGSCGAAVNQRKPVFVSDVLTDPILEQVRDIIAAHGFALIGSKTQRFQEFDLVEILLGPTNSEQAH